MEPTGQEIDDYRKAYKIKYRLELTTQEIVDDLKDWDRVVREGGIDGRARLDN